MTEAFVAPVLSAALQKFKEVVKAHAEQGGREGKRLVVFCEDRLSLVAERAVCEAVGGTFSVAVYTLSRFLSAEAGKSANVLTSQGSAMAIRKIIEDNRQELQLFKRLSTANAAQEVYDTIALLYSSKISADDLAQTHAENRLLARKLHDLEFIYRKYSEYLSSSGSVDRNAYLRRLPDVIRSSEKVAGADVAFLGFQAFTSSVEDCVRASFEVADNVCGIFIGGRERKYVNEGWAQFIKIAGECGKATAGGRPCFLPSPLSAQAEQLRSRIFEPESLKKGVSLGIVRGQLRVAEASDEREECAFFAAEILKCVKECGVRYREISVMLPDLARYQPELERTFGEYDIPFYVDRRYPLLSHPACPFILGYLACAADGCRKESVFSAVASPLFNYGEKTLRADRDKFVNYILRAAGGRGGVKKEINAEICKEAGLDFEATERVRQAFLKGFKTLPQREADGAAFCNGIRELLKLFNAEERLKQLAAEAEECGFASVAEMSGRAYGEVLEVIAEAEKLTSGERLSAREFIKILKSGFAAAEVSLIQPKQDAVFVGDLAKCANTGSKVLFVGGLTDAVPAASQDTAILTDGELTSMEKLKLAVSPKISQVNKRVRETTALNLSAFSERLILTYPVRSGGEECGVSEAIDYVRRLFDIGGTPVKPERIKDIFREEEFAYLNCRPAPALRQTAFYAAGNSSVSDGAANALHKILEESARGNGELKRALAFAETGAKPVQANPDLTKLYGGSVSPTALENYFACPYRAFAQQGLKLSERREGTFRPLDSGNFIHAVLERVASELNGVEGDEQCRALARQTATELLGKTAYLVPEGDGAAEYNAQALVSEAEELAVGMYEQLANSGFTVEGVEEKRAIDLGCGVGVSGRIDRVDSCGDMVRIIDYKTGGIDDSPSSYYMGLKLQLPLYLSAAAEGRRAAGAYYFPANLDYSAENGGAFTLRGFMDGSEDVVKCSDTTLQDKQRSAYFGAYLNGRKVDKAMSREDFADFLSYSKKIAGAGVKEMTGGEIAPSPVGGVCENCKFAGCCVYDLKKFGEREEIKADCKTIAAIARGEERGGEDGK